jgi:membrane protein insertase Oxa1/YidC/SpoIIIJ
MPIILLSIYQKLPALIYLYWSILTIIGIIQTIYVRKHFKMPEEQPEIISQENQNS